MSAGQTPGCVYGTINVRYTCIRNGSSQRWDDGHASGVHMHVLTLLCGPRKRTAAVRARQKTKRAKIMPAFVRTLALEEREHPHHHRAPSGRRSHRCHRPPQAPLQRQRSLDVCQLRLAIIFLSYLASQTCRKYNSNTLRSIRKCLMYSHAWGIGDRGVPASGARGRSC